MIDSKTSFSPEKQTTDSKRPPRTGDDFIDRCFVLEFIPTPDDRTGSRMTGLKDVPGLVKQGLLEDAWVILDKHHQTIKDLDFIYAFKALILQKNSQTEDAAKMLLAGLKFGRSKFLLYERLGFLSFETGGLNEAVTWWIKSIVAMKMLNRLTMWEPFLYLAYVANALAGETYFRILMAKVKEISPQGELCLDDGAIKKINDQSRGLSAPSVLKAIDVLYHYYLRQPDSHPADPVLPETRPQGHPNVPATRDHLLAFNKLFNKNNRNAWINRLIVAVMILALILVFLRFLKSPEEKPVVKIPADLPEISLDLPATEETIEALPVSNPQDQTEKPIPYKTRSPLLKSKIKIVRPSIKGKD